MQDPSPKRIKNTIPMTAIPILPYIPKVNEDEILGSWFSRIASANQVATWKHLLSHCGYKDKNSYPPVDIALPSEKYEMLCNALGRSYASMTLKMTTLPFWLYFESSHSEFIYDKEIQIPKRIIGGRVNVGGFRLRGNLGNLKYCPCCLKEQVADDKNLYWRRSHQLPIALVCHLHPSMLRSACYHCGRIPMLSHQRMLKMPELQCACGVDLTLSPDSSNKYSEQFQMLSKFANGALNTPLPRWNRSQVQDLALAKIEEKFGSNITVAFDAMEAHFGFHRYGKYSLRYLDKETDPRAPSFVLQGVPSVWSASTFVAFFVAIGMSPVDLNNEIGKRPLRKRSPRSRSTLLSVGAMNGSGLETSGCNSVSKSRASKLRSNPEGVNALPIVPDNLTEKLRKAMYQVLRNQKRPSRVTQLELALNFGTTEQKIRKHIADSPEFKAEFMRINEAYHAERIRWKFGQLILQKRNVLINALLNEVSFSRTLINSKIVRDIAKEHPDWTGLLLDSVD